jgi:hypothetical protein
MITRKLFVACAVALAVALAGGALADYTVRSSDAAWTHYTVSRLSDGGVSVELCARAPRTDGGSGITGCDDGEIANATNRTTLLNIGDSLLARWRSRHTD